MKTFAEFIIEAKNVVKDYTYRDPAEQERMAQRERARGFDPEREQAEAKRKAKEEFLRNRSRSTGTASGASRSTGTPPGAGRSAGTPPPSSGGGGRGAGTPPPGAGGGAAGTPPPGPGPSSSGRTPKPYRGRPTSASARYQTVRPPAGSSTARQSSGLSAPVGSKSNPQRINVTNIKGGSKLGKVGRVAGKILGPASAAFDVADERSKGSGWARSLAKGAVVGLGGALGGTAGVIGGGGVGSLALGAAGALGGAEAAGRAFDTVAGANAKERAAMRVANRRRQAGSSLSGIGGPTHFGKKGKDYFMTTGVGKQRKTVQLAKTGVVNRGGQSTAGHLAFKGGKATYKAAPNPQTLAKTSSNPLERIGRTLFAGAYKKHDAQTRARALATARAASAARNKKLGVK